MYVHVNMILDFPKTCKNASVLCSSECACLLTNRKQDSFLYKSNYPKGRALMYQKGEHTCTVF